jgi:hypothetical protein
MSHASARIVEEVRKVLVAASFFAIGFCLIIVAERLFVKGSAIEVTGVVRAVVGGLVVAKVLLLVDLLPFVHAFPHKPLVHNVLWKSSLYIVASLIFRYLEPFIKSLFKGVGLYAAHSGALRELMLPRTWAIEIWLAMLLLVFVSMQELSRVIGKEEFRAMFFGAKSKPPERRLRAA